MKSADWDNWPMSKPFWDCIGHWSSYLHPEIQTSTRKVFEHCQLSHPPKHYFRFRNRTLSWDNLCSQDSLSRGILCSFDQSWEWAILDVPISHSRSPPPIFTNVFQKASRESHEGLTSQLLCFEIASRLSYQTYSDLKAATVSITLVEFWDGFFRVIWVSMA